MESFFRRELSGVGFGLGLMFGLVIQSLLLFGFESWLHDRGGWPLVIIGLVAFWSAILASMMLSFAVQKRRHDRAINAALAKITDRLPKAAEPAESDKDESYSDVQKD